MRIALFGGTGFVGGYIVDGLLRAGHEPSVLVRPGSEHKIRQRQHCAVVNGDLASPSAIDAVLNRCDGIIYCVGILREDRIQGATFEALQYDGVVRVAAAARSMRISRFLLMSANGVKSPGTPYQETKYRAEQHLRNESFDVTIFRPSVIFGDPHGKMEFASRLKRDMVSMPFPAIDFRTGFARSSAAVTMSPVHVEDVAEVFVAALGDTATVGMTYDIGGPEALSWRDMLCRIEAVVGRRKWHVPVPIPLMKVPASLLDWLPFFPVTRDQLTMLAEGNTADPAVLQSLLGRPPKPFDAAALSYLAG